VIPTSLSPRILAMTSDERLSNLLRLPGVAVREIEVDDPGVLRDVDRPEDLARAPA